MKIGIIGDVHLGASYKLGRAHPTLGINTRLLDFTNTLEQTINSIVEMGAEEIVFTGDIFEHRHPTLREQAVFSQQLQRAHMMGIRCSHIVIGNHDQDRRDGAITLSYLKELDLDHVVVHDEMNCVPLEFNGKLMANLILMPYRDRMWLGEESYIGAIQKMRELLNYKLSLIENDAPRILVGHMGIEGTLFDEEYRDIYNENQLMLPKDMFENINVTLMGHIHKPEIFCEDPYIAYVGSMEKTAGFETHDKVFAMLDLEHGQVTFHKEPCRDIHDIDLDYSSLALGEDLFTQIKEDIDQLSQEIRFEASIVRGSVKLSAEDESHYNARKVSNYIRETYKAHTCHNLHKKIYSPRQSRDERITEDISDSEALRFFLENTIDDPTLRAELIEAGIEIVRSARVA